MLAPPYRIRKREIIFIFAVFGIAFALRILYLRDYLNSDTFPILQYSDSYSYFLWAKDILSGDLWGSKAFMKWPLYAYFLSFLLKLFKGNVTAVYLFQYLLGALNCVLVYFIARRIFNEAVARISALLCAWYGLFLFYDSLLIYTNLSLFLNSLLFLFLLSIKDEPDNKKLFLAGIFLGICVITQASIALFGIFAIILILKAKEAPLRKLLLKFFLFLFGFAVIIGSVALKNFFAEKDFVLISGNVGFNFYSGNNPRANGTFFCPANIALNQEDMFRDARILANAETGRSLTTAQVSRFWFNKAVVFIQKEPGKWLVLLFRKIKYLFSPVEFIHDLEYNFLTGKTMVFKAVLMDLRFILPFSLLGIILAFKRIRQVALLYIALITVSFSICLFFVTARYRIVMVPYFMIFAAFGLVTTRESLRERRYFRFTLFCLALSAIFICQESNRLAMQESGIDSKSDSSAFNYHLSAALNYENRSDYQRALRELNLAENIEPHNYRAIFRQGTVYFRLDDFKNAEEKFKETVRINPLSVDAYYNLGFIYNRQSRFTQAQDSLKKAVSLDPEYIEAHFELGKAYKANGKPALAKEEFNLALKKINRWRQAERAIIEKELASLEK